ncbi:MAG: heavy-metal-associated domain-containing protein [Pelotomaculum sp.]|jgi:copper chaperone
MATIILNVWGMECGHCKAAVSKALMEAEGVSDVSIHLPTGKATVTYDPAIIGYDKMVEVVKKAGYEVLDYSE